ncbi:MAG: S1C family serine protease [Patescibacteria group bacterium]|nr:S1C family serine protease [Patescibacteria group bacterium]
MDIEELNKTQIILLTLLVSFVTSIATGIVTVSLVNQAPPVVTDTIHKVIEKTVEKVVPGEQQATVIENTKTIIVSDQDFVIKAIEKNSQSIVRVFSSVVDKDGIEEITFVGLGVIISADGEVIMDNTYLADLSNSEEIEQPNYFIKADELRLNLSISRTLAGNNDTSILQIQVPEETGMTFAPIELGDSDALKLGQSIVALGGAESNVVLTGIVSNLKRDKLLTGEVISETDPETGGVTEVEELKIMTIEIETNLSPQLPMGLLIDLEGKAIGLKSKTGYYIPINIIKRDIDGLSQITTKTMTTVDEQQS